MTLFYTGDDEHTFKANKEMRQILWMKTYEYSSYVYVPWAFEETEKQIEKYGNLGSDDLWFTFDENQHIKT